MEFEHVWKSFIAPVIKKLDSTNNSVIRLQLLYESRSFHLSKRVNTRHLTEFCLKSLLGWVSMMGRLLEPNGKQGLPHNTILDREPKKESKTL